MRLRLLSLLALWPALAAAQEAPAVRAAQQHLRASATARMATADLDDLRPVALREDARTGLTLVTLAQYHHGIEVFGTASTAAVRRDGSVAASAPRIETDLARRAGPSTPAVSAVAAAATAEALALRVAERLASEPGAALVTDDPEADRQRHTPAVRSGEPRLGYHEMPDGTLRLAWATVVTSTSGPAVLRDVRIDALTGEILADLDLVVHDAWPSAPPAERVPTPRQSPVFVDLGPPVDGATYRVIAAPFESPSVGEFALVTNPADPVASPRGWHDDGQSTYTITRGNNVHAYADANADNAPDAGSAPDGGAGLVFDFPFDPDMSPASNAPAAITNLFYWNNIAHDVLFRYGFDEAAGNFQVANAIGGRGLDAVRAEALDGAGTNNANFGTPPDGQAPRMQMFRWTGNAAFSITGPDAIDGPYPSAGAGFGPGGDFAGTLRPTEGPNGETTGCPAEGIANDLTGRVALIERGDCLFVEKVYGAQLAGAIAVVIYNKVVDPSDPEDNGGEALVSMGGSDPRISIPSAFVQRSTGLLMRASTAPVTVAVEQLADRDSGLDAGVVVHEYGHGVSNRLIGGPSRVSCLTNGYTDSDNPSANRPGEQMGEGWSDFYGLMLTQRPGDTGRQPRGVGTYLRFETPDGQGIRNAPYSTDFAINDYTYQDVIDHAAHSPSGARGLSIPHGVGFVWASMLWEMTWELIDAFGASPNVADAGGTAGNQIALNLVTTGLSLTPCTPGFVDGRDAILAADQALYGGAYAEYIWAAFARRGLGLDASQGSSESHTDGTASFTAPSQLGVVAFAEPEITASVLPGEVRVVEVDITSQRGVPEPFVVAELPPWLSVSPTTGTIPARGTASLSITVAPAPLDAGPLAAAVVVLVGDEDTPVVLPIDVETDGAVDGYALSVIGPNPSREVARFTLAVGDAQTVAVSLYDPLGRRVRTQSAALDADVRRTFALDVAGLAGGLYVLRIEGEDFADTRTLTVVR